MRTNSYRSIFPSDALVSSILGSELWRLPRGTIANMSSLCERVAKDLPKGVGSCFCKKLLSLLARGCAGSSLPVEDAEHFLRCFRDFPFLSKPVAKSPLTFSLTSTRTKCRQTFALDVFLLCHVTRGYGFGLVPVPFYVDEPAHNALRHHFFSFLVACRSFRGLVNWFPEYSSVSVACFYESCRGSLRLLGWRP